MSTFKPFLSSDIITTPFVVNKGFTFQGINKQSVYTTSSFHISGFGSIIFTLPSLQLYEIQFKAAAPFPNFLLEFGFISGSLLSFITGSSPSIINSTPINFNQININNDTAANITVTDFIIYEISPSASSGLDTVGIDRFIGTKITGSLFNPETDPTTGYYSNQYQRLVFDSIQTLFYSNYLSSSYGDNIATASLIPGSGPSGSGDTLVGPVQSKAYDNYPQTDLTYPKYFPTTQGSVIGVISIPQILFGNYILPGSFIYSTPSGSVYDDGEGNVLDDLGDICGNIFYPQGIITITSGSTLDATGAKWGTATYATSSYGESFLSGSGSISNLIISNNVTCSFSSSILIYDTHFKCTIRENEFNTTLNPSLQTDNSGSIQSFSTSSYFAPYITTVGLYNSNQQLIAVGKLAQPIRSSPTTDLTILVNLDH